MRRSLVVALIALALPAGAAAAPAQAATSVAPQQIVWPHPNVAPPGFRITSRQAEAIALRSNVGRRLRAKHPDTATRVYLQTGYWEVDFLGRKIVLGEVDVDGRSGRVTQTWTGWQASTFQSRGHFGGLADSWWVWLPLCVLFVAPFFDFRRPFRLLHLDLLVLLSFGVSQLFFNQGLVLAAVPLFYPVLAYLFARMVRVGLRGRPGRGRLVPHARASWLVAGLVALVAFRIFVNVAAGHVVDVGYAGVVGADRIEHGLPLYVANNAHGDTYGPINYIAYVPFELVFKWHGAWDSLPAAHAAALFFDLLVLAGLFLAGTRLRAGPEGRRLGLALAYGWAAYPYTLYALAANTNDALVAALLVFAFLALRSPLARGGWLGLGIAAKFVPLALAPLFAAGTGDRRPRPVALFAAAAVGIVGLALGLYVPQTSFHDFWASTISYQLHRISPFSIWTLYPSLHLLQVTLSAATALFVGALAFVPRRRNPVQLAALAAAVLVAVQIVSGNWFYFYVVWFAPFALIALFASSEAEPVSPRSRARHRGHEAPRRSDAPAVSRTQPRDRAGAAAV